MSAPTPLVVITHAAPGPGPLPQVHDHYLAVVQASVTHQRPSHRSLGAMVWMAVSLPNSYVKIPRGLRPLGSPVRTAPPTPRPEMTHVLCTAQWRPAEAWKCSAHSALQAVDLREKDPPLCARGWGYPEGTRLAHQSLAWFRSSPDLSCEHILPLY